MPMTDAGDAGALDQDVQVHGLRRRIARRTARLRGGAASQFDRRLRAPIKWIKRRTRASELAGPAVSSLLII